MKFETNITWYYTDDELNKDNMPDIEIGRIIKFSDGAYFESHRTLTEEECEQFNIEKKTPDLYTIVDYADYLERYDVESKDLTLLSAEGHLEAAISPQFSSREKIIIPVKNGQPDYTELQNYLETVNENVNIDIGAYTKYSGQYPHENGHLSVYIGKESNLTHWLIEFENKGLLKVDKLGEVIDASFYKPSITNELQELLYETFPLGFERIRSTIANINGDMYYVLKEVRYEAYKNNKDVAIGKSRNDGFNNIFNLEGKEGEWVEYNKYTELDLSSPYIREYDDEEEYRM